MIREVRLVNVKSYSDQTIRFEEGVNAVIGENGAGKTTILEAIGFVLFNTLPYNISDFVKRGERRAEIRVKIVNPKDERLYEVVRRIEEGRTVEYFVRDAETGVRIEGVEGVAGITEWIRDVFGFETDAKTIFENAIGVGQGKITSQFLESAGVRDKIFSPLIGVEGYKKAFEKSREYEKFIEIKLKEIEKEIALLQKEIENLNKLKSKLESLNKEKESILAQISKIDDELIPLEKKIDEIEVLLRKLNELRVEEAKLVAELRNIDSNVQRLRDELKRIEQAENELKSLKGVYEEYVRAEAELIEVERRKDEVERKLEELRSKSLKLERLKAELDELRNKLDEIERCEDELRKIEPFAEREETLMERLREIEIAENKIKSLEEQRERLEKDISKLSEELKEIKAKSERLKEIEVKLKKIPEDVEGKRDKAIQAIAKLKQMLEEELKQFERIKDGKCPILGEDCDRIAKVAKVKAERIAKIKAKLKEFEGKLKILDKLCRKRRELEDELNVIRVRVEARDTVEQELNQKTELLKTIESELEEIRRLTNLKPDVESEYERVKGSIERKIALMDRVKKKEGIVRDIQAKEKEVDEIVQELAESDDLQSVYDELRDKVSKLRELLKNRRDGYERFLRLRGEIEKKDEIKSLLESLEARQNEIRSKLERIRAEIDDIKRHCDEEEYKTLRRKIQELRDSKAKLEGELNKLENHIEDFKKEIEDCKRKEEILKKRVEDRKKLERKFKFIKDLREIFKRAIPEITKAYVEAVSAEANRIFCEIMGDYNWELRWTEDFGIKAKYMGKEIDFAQMSGGEQICAALAVRLALLKVLSNIGIVFFDEPTQNMDETRRRNFAMQLSRIEGFKQIFVISHDDTFEEMVEHAIKVKKENGVSIVE